MGRQQFLHGKRVKKAVLTSNCFESDRGQILCSLLNHSQELVFYSRHNRMHLEDVKKEIKDVICQMNELLP